MERVELLKLSYLQVMPNSYYGHRSQRINTTGPRRNDTENARLVLSHPVCDESSTHTALLRLDHLTV